MKQPNLKSKKVVTVIKDLILSMLAYAFPALSLTFIIQPYMASIVDADVYGLFLVQLGIVRLISLIFTGPLSNLRLLLNNEYQEKKLAGDFSALLLFAVFASPIVLVAVLLFYNTTNLCDYILCVITLLFITLHDYFAVFFRVVIQYSKLIWNNILVVVGYIVGLVIYSKYPIWQIVIISGYLFGLSYLFFTSPYCKETPMLTPLFPSTRKKYTQLSFSYLIRESIHYCDKLVIYPLLGSAQVSVYNAAAVVGKALYLVTTPMNNVILSYIPRLKALTRRLLCRLLLLSIPILIVAYGAMYIAGRILLPLLYPQFCEEATSILWCIVLAILLGTAASLLNPLLLRFDKMSSQIRIPGIKLLLYIVTSVIFSKYFGLLGFSFGYLLSSVFHLSLMLFRLIRIAIRTDKEQKLTELMSNNFKSNSEIGN